MKNKILIIFCAVFAFISGCRNNDCQHVITYSPIDSRLTGYIFKPGTYWVYSDTVDGIIDSQYVYSYAHKVHYRSPLDTPNRYYNTVSPGGSLNNVYCGPYYEDTLSMSYISYRNGIFADTLALGAPNSIDLHIKEHYNQVNQIGTFCFQLDFTQIGLSGGTISVTPPSDTVAVWYRGELNNLVENNNTFNNINIWGIQLGSPNSSRFIYPTDLYFASGYGIVKIVEHRPSGDIPWILLRYHIIS